MDNQTDHVEGTSIGDFIREMLADGVSEDIQSYLKAGVLSSAVEALFKARKAANLTQDEVAQRLKTKQPGVVRFEADLGGSMSLRRYVEFALACGKVPLIALEEVASVERFALEYPGGPFTAEKYMGWLHQNQPSIQSAPPMTSTVVASTAAGGFTPYDGPLFAQAADQHLRQVQQHTTHPAAARGRASA